MYDMYDNWDLPFLSITLHLKISCPSSPAVPMAHGRGMAFPVPQVKIEMESDYDTDTDHPRHRDMSSETTL
jgi:sodium bicarbonate cotransporter 5